MAFASALATLSIIAWYLTSPARLVLTSEIDPAAMVDPQVPFEVPPRVEVHNRLGWVSRARDGETVRIVAARRDPVRLAAMPTGDGPVRWARPVVTMAGSSCRSS